jgi:hypothetical protein
MTRQFNKLYLQKSRHNTTDTDSTVKINKIKIAIPFPVVLFNTKD